MPNIKSAIKRVSVIEHKTLRNKMVKSATKTAIKKFDAELAASPATAGAQYSVTASAIDKAAAKGITIEQTDAPTIIEAPRGQREQPQRKNRRKKK